MGTLASSCFLFILCHLSCWNYSDAMTISFSPSNVTSYLGACVEFSPLTNSSITNSTDALQLMLINLRSMEPLIQRAVQSNVQIIALPEDSLFGSYFPTRKSIFPFLEPIPEVSSTIIPCVDSKIGNSSPILARISCVARELRVNLVAHMAEIEYCSNDEDPLCPADSHYQYSTQIALSENGTLIAKNRKSNLVNQPQFDSADNEPIKFNTSFGVTFGLMLGFDLLLEYPQADLLPGVEDFILSTSWENQPPYLTGNNLAQSWSSLHAVNLISASTGNGWKTSGSGIYSNGKTLAGFFNAGTEDQTQLLNSKIQTNSKFRRNGKPSHKNADLRLHKFPWKQFQESPKWTTFAASKGSTGSLNVSFSSTFTCYAKYSITSGSSEIFALYAYEGPLLNLPVFGQICALFRCNSKNCLSDFVTKTSTKFGQFSLTGTFSSGKGQLLYMLSQNDDQSVDPANYNTGNCTISSNNYDKLLLSASILHTLWK